MAPVDTLVCDTAQVVVWQSDPVFAYSRELIAPEINVLEWLSGWFGRMLDKIFGNTFVEEYSDVVLICVAALILMLVIWFVYKKRPELFMCPRKSALLYTVGEDTIYGVDFAEKIAGALAREDYREAVRLLYLQTLKRLSDGKRIEWQLYKTPTQYIYEVRLSAFREMTNHFLRVRYGNFEANETLFRMMLALQKEVEKGGTA